MVIAELRKILPGEELAEDAKVRAVCGVPRKKAAGVKFRLY